MSTFNDTAYRIIPAYEDCATCHEYGQRRMTALLPHLAAKRDREGLTSLQVLDDYMDRVHDRHLSGLTLDTP